MTLPQRTLSGAEIDLSRIFLSAPSGAASIPAVRFFALSGAQVNSGAGASPVTLTLDSNYTSLKTLWETAATALAPSCTWETSVNRTKATSVISDAVSSEVWVSLGEPSPAAPSFRIQAGDKLRVGMVPSEIEGGSVWLSGSVNATLAGLTRAEDSPSASGDNGVPMLAVRRDGYTSLVGADGDYGMLQLTSQGRLRTSSVSEQPSTVTGTVDGANSLQMDVTGFGGVGVWLVSGGTVNVTLQGSHDGANWITLLHWDPASQTPSQTTSSGAVSTAAGRMAHTCGFRTLRVSYSSGSTTSVIQVERLAYVPFPQLQFNAGAALVRGNGGHASTAVSSGLHHLGEGRSADGSAVSSGQGTRQIMTLVGKGVVLPYALPGQTFQSTATLSGTNDSALAAAAGAGVRNYITSLVLANETGTSVIVAIKDGSTVVARVPVPGGGGAVVPLPVPLRGSPNTAINAACLTSAGGNVYASAVGYTAAE